MKQKILELLRKEEPENQKLFDEAKEVIEALNHGYSIRQILKVLSVEEERKGILNYEWTDFRTSRPRHLKIPYTLENYLLLREVLLKS